MFEFLKRDPTTDWPIAESKRLRFDVERGTVDGIPFGAPLDAIQRFGKPSNRGWRSSHSLGHPALGLETTITRERTVFFFTSYFRPTDSVTDLEKDPNFVPCTAELVFPQHGPFTIDHGSTLGTMEGMFGSLGATADGEARELRSAAVYLRFEFDEEQRVTTMDFEPVG